MARRAGHLGMVAVAIGALAGGLVSLVLAPSTVWAGLVGGALTGGAVHAGLALLRSGDGDR